jgi:hypothetical protein
MQLARKRYCKAQQQIVSNTKSSEPDGNAAMQLNMGEGKSTVIILVAAAPKHEGAEPADNAVMQLNMGEGKSAVMIPMIHEAAALTNGSQLVRVAVAKPQSKQMAEMLIARFGGLLDRRIYSSIAASTTCRPPGHSSSTSPPPRPC